MLMKSGKFFYFKILFAQLCLLSGLAAGSSCTRPEGEIYHIVTTVCEDASSAVTVNYHCNLPGSYVLVTQADDTTFRRAKKIKPVCQSWSTVGIENTAKESTFYTKERYVCYATLSGLKDDTRYIYKIVAGKTRTDARRFKTAAKEGPWNFVVFTDFQHRENPVTLPLIQMMKEIASPELVICSGDQIDVAGNEYEWTFLLDNDIFRDFVYAASPGDHAYWASDQVDGHYPQYDYAYTFNRLFKFPENGAPSSRNTTYYFYYNNILFVALDMNNSDIATGERFNDQQRWFEETLDRLAGTYQYLIVYEHKSVFGSELVDPVVGRELRPQWYPLFQKYGVDLVLSGHDHIYSRTYALDGDQPSADPSKGTFYLDMGSSGDKRRPLDESLTGSPRYAKVMDLRALRQSCACNIEVDETCLKVTVYNKDRQVVDSFVVPRKDRPAVSESREDFLFVHMTDPQIGFRDDSPGYGQTDTLMQKAVALANALRPEAVFVTGDLVNDAANPFQDAIFTRNLAALTAPVWCIPGNHDSFSDRFSFRMKGCAFIGLDTNCIKDAAPEAEAAQFDWLTQQLENARDARYTFVFLHCPLVRESLDEPEDYFNFSKEQRRRYLDLFTQYGVDAVFAGHTHCDYTTEISGIRFYTANPVGKTLKHGISGFNLIKVGPVGFEVKFLPTR